MKDENEFAKIVWCQGYQIVVMISYDDEEDVYNLCQITNIKGVEASLKAGFKDEKRCVEAFDDYSDEMANGFINSMLKYF